MIVPTLVVDGYNGFVNDESENVVMLVVSCEIGYIMTINIGSCTMYRIWRQRSCAQKKEFKADLGTIQKTIYMPALQLEYLAF